MTRSLWCLLAFLLCCGGMGFGQAARVNDASCTSGSNDCNVTLSVTSGNKALAFMSSTSVSSNTLSASDTDADSSSTLVTQFADAGNNVVIKVMCFDLTHTNASEVFDLHATSSANWFNGSVEQVSGAPSCASLVRDFATGSFSATTALASGTTGTSSQTNDLTIGFFGFKGIDNSGYTFTAGTNFTARSDAHSGSGNQAVVAIEDSTTTGLTQATETSSLNGSGAGVIVIVKASGGGSTPTCKRKRLGVGC